MPRIYFKTSWIVLALFTGLFFAACDQTRLYEQNADFKDRNWFVDSVKSFSFKIEDTTQLYNLLLNVRNSEVYPYYNLFLRYSLSDSLKKDLKSQQLELILMDPKTGKPAGKGLGDIYNHQFGLLQKFHFVKPGVYTVKIKQYMRQDPLPEVYSIGLRVEKVKEKKK